MSLPPPSPPKNIPRFQGATGDGKRLYECRGCGHFERTKPGYLHHKDECEHVHGSAVVYEQTNNHSPITPVVHPTSRAAQVSPASPLHDSTNAPSTSHSFPASHSTASTTSQSANLSPPNQGWSPPAPSSVGNDGRHSVGTYSGSSHFPQEASSSTSGPANSPPIRRLLWNPPGPSGLRQSITTAPANTKKASRQSRTARAGLIVSVSRSEARIRDEARKKVRVTKKAPVFLAAAVQYILSELLEVSAIKAAETGSRAIKPETIREAVALDADLCKLFQGVIIRRQQTRPIHTYPTAKKGSKETDEDDDEEGEVSETSSESEADDEQ